MKTLIKNKKTFSLLLLCLFLIIGFSIANKKEARAIEFKQQIAIPGITTSTLKLDQTTRPLGEYIKGIYNYGIGIIAILATAVMMFGGFQWIIAGGSAEKVGEAKAWIGASLTGLVLALSSYTILNLINPNLTSLKVQKIETVQPLISECCDNNTGIEVSPETSHIIKTSATHDVCPEGSSDCNSYCNGKDPGKKCGIGYCYNNKCLFEEGKENEPCGDNGSSTCYDGNFITPCPSGLSLFDLIVIDSKENPTTKGGRDCGSGLYCCSTKK